MKKMAKLSDIIADMNEKQRKSMIKSLIAQGKSQVEAENEANSFFGEGQ